MSYLFLLRLPDSYQEGIMQARMAGMIVTVLGEPAGGWWEWKRFFREGG
jgi:hypothetical protein